jgi:hypothetical protein
MSIELLPMHIQIRRMTGLKLPFMHKVIVDEKLGIY